MKAASGQLQSFLASASTTPADLSVFSVDLYTFALVNGVVLRWTSGDRVISLPQGTITGTAHASGGTGYAVGDTGSFVGVSIDATYIITGVSGGVVTSYNVTNTGTKYQIWNSVATIRGGAQPGSGIGFTINVTSVGATLTFIPLSPSALGNPAIKRSKVNSTVGLSVDDLTLEIYASAGVIVNGTQFQSALVRGDFDGATVFSQRLISTSPGDVSMGTITTFAGIVGDITDIGPVSSKLAVKSMTELLNIQMPRNYFQPGCLNTLFDAGCTLSKSAYNVAGIVGAGATVITIPSNLTQPGPIAPPASAPSLSSTTILGLNLVSNTFYVVVTYVNALGETQGSPESVTTLGSNRLLVVASPSSATGVIGYNVYVGFGPGGEQKQNGSPIAIGTAWTMGGNGVVQGVPPPQIATNGYFSQGVITFTSGVNSGLSRVVIGYATGGTVTILVGLPVAPASGDHFTIVPGCDKQQSTCQNKFNNLINIRATPYVPQPEAVL